MDHGGSRLENSTRCIDEQSTSKLKTSIPYLPALCLKWCEVLRLKDGRKGYEVWLCVGYCVYVLCVCVCVVCLCVCYVTSVLDMRYNVTAGRFVWDRQTDGYMDRRTDRPTKTRFYTSKDVSYVVHMCYMSYMYCVCFSLVSG